MIVEGVTLGDALLGTGGIGAAVLFIKFLAKQGFGGALDVKEMGARNDIIEDLRTEIRGLRIRVEDLEAKVVKLQGRLVDVREHALTAFGVVQTKCSSCPLPQRDILLDSLSKITKGD